MSSVMDPVYADTRTPGKRIDDAAWQALSDAERADRLSPDDWRRIDHNLSKALISLLVNFPYFGSMVAAMASDRVWLEDRKHLHPGVAFDTLATDGRRLYLWPPFVLHVPPKFLAAALLHELLHNVLLHPARGIGFDSLLANQAMDYSVNLMVNDAALRRANKAPMVRMTPALYDDLTVYWYVPVADDFCYDERFREANGDPMAWERIYALLKRESPPARLLDGHAVWKPGNRPADEHGNVNDRRFDPDVIRGWVHGAQQFRNGKDVEAIPAGVLREIEAWMNPPLPWHRLLQAYLKVAPGDFTWAPGDLRFPDPMPSWSEQPDLTWVTFGFDLSGSMSDRDIAACIANARAILRSYPGTKGRAYFWDSEVHQACDLDDFDGAITRGVAGGGGTLIAPQFAAIAADGLADKTCCHVCFTDGLVDWNEIDPDKLPSEVLWVLTTDGHDPPPHHRYRTTRLETT